MMISALICFTVCYLVGGGWKLRPAGVHEKSHEKNAFNTQQKITIAGAAALLSPPRFSRRMFL